MAREMKSSIDQGAFKMPFERLLRKLLYAFIASGFILLAIFSYKSWIEQGQDMQRNLAIQAGFASKSSQAVFDDIGTSMEMMGKLLAKTDVVKHPELARSALDALQDTHPSILAVSLITPNGKILLSNNTELSNNQSELQKDPDYMRSFMIGLNNTYSYNIERKQFGKGVNQSYIPFHHVITDVQGNPLYVIQVAISEEVAGMLWSDLPLLSGSRVGLLRDDGYIQLVWPTPKSKQDINKPQTGGLLQQISAHPGRISGFYEGQSSIDNSMRMGAYVHLSNANMFAFVSVPKKLIIIRWWELNNPILLSFLVYLGLISAIAMKLSGMERKHTHDLLAQSRKDPLTDLPNRIAIDEILNSEIARDRRHDEHSAILYLNLDKFKDINDKLGHSSGDRLLKLIGMRLKEILREEDVIARLGGDEFLVMMPNADAEKSSLLAQRIIDLLTIPFQVSGQHIVISSSIGICIMPDDGNNGSLLLQNADTAMHEAKQNGRNCYSFYRKVLGEHIRKRLQLQHDFHRALKNKEFILYYQPLVDLANGKIVGAEALVRWMDPVKGIRNPAEFIPFAEESGDILLLGEWVLKAACHEAKIWADQGHEIYVAVNLSTRQFQDPSLLLKISDALSNAALMPTKLELEITESASMQNPEASIQVMNQLKALGIKIAIDDFGTGYSSLAYLKRIPADIIKIDRSFVNGIQNDADDLAIVRTIIALGLSLEKRCLAEGIETSEQFEILYDLGCHFGQGYWMHKPISNGEFLNILNENKCYFHQI